MSGFSSSQYRDTSDFLLKHPNMSREDAIGFLDRELKKMEGNKV